MKNMFRYYLKKLFAATKLTRCLYNTAPYKQLFVFVDLDLKMVKNRVIIVEILLYVRCKGH